MSFRTAISDDGRYLIGKVDEPITREIIIQLTKEYIELINTTGINRIVSDFRGLWVRCRITSLLTLTLRSLAFRTIFALPLSLTRGIRHIISRRRLLLMSDIQSRYFTHSTKPLSGF